MPEPAVRETSGEDAAERLRGLLARRGAAFARVRLRNNRTRLLSLSADRGTLNLHEALAHAPPEVLDAVAHFCGGRSRRKRHAAAAVIRDFVSAVRPAPQPPARRPPCCAGTAAERAWLRDLYLRLNHKRFGGRLPAGVPLRLSARMRSRLGHFVPRTGGEGRREAGEIAINGSLLAPGREADLHETLLHEMAHLEAWLFHGSRRHDRDWKACARAAGCRPRACL